MSLQLISYGAKASLETYLCVKKRKNQLVVRVRALWLLEAGNLCADMRLAIKTKNCEYI